MPDSLSIALGTVLATLEIIETKHGVIQDVRLVEVEDKPTNLIEFTMGDHIYEVTVNKARRTTPHLRPSLQRVKLNIRESSVDHGTKGHPLDSGRELTRA